MTDAILIFTFGPVQGFISEARRASDLAAGSKILVELARAAGQSIGEERLVYPASLADDIPNVIVARVPMDQAKDLATSAGSALLTKWRGLAGEAHQRLSRLGPAPDAVWQTIWDRQITGYWECHWAAAQVDEGSYASAYDTARRALDAAKRTRTFGPSQEDGAKDTLGGTRAALRTASMDAREHWSAVATAAALGRIRAGGRERLDAIGSVKRFGACATSIDSVSDVATADFRDKAKQARSLNDYETFLSSTLGLPATDSEFLYADALTSARLKTEYGLVVADDVLRIGQSKLKALYDEVAGSPNPYYAVIRLDGDSMGELVSSCQTEAQHRSLSTNIANFANRVPCIVRRHLGTCIYAGGDDVLALAPLSTALPMAKELGEAFRGAVPTGHASAGIALVHHLSPLDAALRTASDVERLAKRVKGKDAVAVEIVKRSGEPVVAASHWNQNNGLLQTMVEHYREDRISTRFGYDVLRVAYALDDAQWQDRGAALAAELRRLIGRHTDDAQKGEVDASGLAESLAAWTDELAETTRACESYLWERTGRAHGGVQMLVAWLQVACFLAKGGEE